LDVLGNSGPVGSTADPTKQANFERYRYRPDKDGRITIRRLDHSKRIFDLTEGLIRRGYSDANITLILGGNAVRVFREIWKS
jgi:microsomal dipeptidase-like Zn-dependent dipeptidase